LANGIVTGASIALMALAFQLVFLPIRVFHVSLGAVFTGVPYAAWLALQGGLPTYMVVICGILFAILFSLALEVINHSPLERRNASFVAHLIASLGIYIFFAQVIAVAFGNSPKHIRTFDDFAVRFGDVIVTGVQVGVVVVCTVTLVAFFVWLRMTNLGLRFRALADNPSDLALLGYNVSGLRLLAFGLSGFAVAITSLAGIGPVMGGLLLGILRANVIWFFEARWQDVVMFTILALFLLFRPDGIVGKKMRVEAQA
jgi:branched-chain amino acid transport system permease protein